MSDSDRALARALADACLGELNGRAVGDDLRSFLARHGVASDDIEAAIAAPRGLAVYRSLVQNGLMSVVGRLMPRTRARMNRACDGRFDVDMARFLNEASPRTHYLRDVPSELFAWAQPRWRVDAAVPPYLVDLAAQELACFAIATSEATTGPITLDEIALDRSFSFAPSMQLADYSWAVHELGAEDNDAIDIPAHREVHLLGFRDSSHTVCWFELTPLAASIVERLAAGDSLGAGIAAACRGRNAQADTAEVAQLLADLSDRGVLLGARNQLG
ncbi:MAG TPA: hypothetical protein VGY54_16115 [Polyangiaceae bacterium]|nr:hypothetical protein [Polyangiaceae bacterium]